MTPRAIDLLAQLKTVNDTLTALQEQINKSIGTHQRAAYQSAYDIIDRQTSITISLINSITDKRLSNLLIYRYADNQGWSTIADLISYNEVYVRGELHQRAIRALQRRIDTYYKNDVTKTDTTKHNITDI